MIVERVCRSITLIKSILEVFFYTLSTRNHVIAEYDNGHIVYHDIYCLKVATRMSVTFSITMYSGGQVDVRNYYIFNCYTKQIYLVSY